MSSKETQGPKNWLKVTWPLNTVYLDINNHVTNMLLKKCKNLLTFKTNNSKFPHDFDLCNMANLARCLQPPVETAPGSASCSNCCTAGWRFNTQVKVQISAPRDITKGRNAERRAPSSRWREQRKCRKDFSRFHGVRHRCRGHRLIIENHWWAECSWTTSMTFNTVTVAPICWGFHGSVFSDASFTFSHYCKNTFKLQRPYSRTKSVLMCGRNSWKLALALYHQTFRGLRGSFI